MVIQINLRHERVDTLVCYLCRKNKTSENEDDEQNSRNLDPYEDEVLLYFIKNGRHGVLRLTIIWCPQLMRNGMIF
jgi:hypothetical protein